MTDPPPQSRDVLLVEDNPGDVRLLEEAFEPVQLVDALHVVTDGDDALDFVFQRGAYADAPRPDVILLNWTLPGTSGESVLAELKGTATLRRIPTIVVTSSKSHREMQTAYELQANAFVTKPTGPEGFADLARSIRTFWLGHVSLPVADRAKGRSTECL